MLKYWLNLAFASISDPKTSLRAILDRQHSLAEIAVAAAFLAALSVLAAEAVTRVSPVEQADSLAVTMQPITGFVVQFMMIMLGGIAIFSGGRMFGGRGSLADSVLAITWLEFVLFLVQIVILVTYVVFPVLAALMYLSAIVLVIYLLVNFIMEVHGFTSVLAVASGVIVGVIVVGMVLLVVFALFGVEVEMDGMAQNV